MSLSNPISHSIAAYQQQLLQLDAGTELLCRQGTLRVRFGHGGAVHTLSAGQAVRLPDTQWVTVEATQSGRFSLQADPQQAGEAEKNRQGLAGLWRSLVTRLMVRRGPRAA